MEQEQGKDFFVSYASVDKRWAEWIAWQLESVGFTTIIQAWDSYAGSNFIVDVNAAVIQAKRTIAVLSPDYLASKFTPSEWAVAFRQDPRGEHGILMPVRVRSCDVKGLLGQIVYIDLVGQNEPIARQRLLEGANRQRQKPTHSPVFPLMPPPAFPGALPPFWNIPYPRNPYFTGREDILSRIAAALRTGHLAAIGQPQAISGLGGIGKTQIAIEYAYRYHQDYQAVLWVRAETKDELISGYVALAGLLQLPQQEEKGQLTVVEVINNWLRTHGGWLLILDNADNLALVREFLLPTSQGHILLTTRASSTGRLANLIEVEKLGQEEGTHFLLRRAGLLDGDSLAAPKSIQETAQELVQEMDGLPLALDQAGAYIEEIKCSIGHYLTLYRTHRAQLLRERGGLVPDHPEPVTTTWSLSFQRIADQSLAAADLLQACAFLQPDAIPEEILRDGGKYLGPHIQTLAADPIAFDQALKLLLSYSLIRRNTSDEQLSIHRLVQAVLTDGMDEQAQREWAERIVAAIHAVLPNNAEDHHQWKRFERRLVQALDCVALINRWQMCTTAAFWLLCTTGRYLKESARYPESETLYQRALEIGEQVLGPKHPDVAYTFNELATLYRVTGKYREAEPFYERALEIREQVLGPKHPDVAYILNGLATLYSEQARYQEAEPFYERALQIYELVLGPEHPRIAYLLNNLANLYRDQNKYKEAEPLYKRALYIREQILGPEHPKVAFPLNNLANLYRDLGKYREAELLYERALEISKQALGSEHPDVAYPLTGLGDLYREQGRYREAEPFYERALRIFRQALGSEYPQAAHPLNGLAELYREEGRYEEAESVYKQALQICEQGLGREHPLIIKVAKNYIVLLRTMNRDSEVDDLKTRFLLEM